MENKISDQNLEMIKQAVLRNIEKLNPPQVVLNRRLKEYYYNVGYITASLTWVIICGLCLWAYVISR